MNSDPDPRPIVAIDLVEPSPHWRYRLSDVDHLCIAAAQAALAAAGTELEVPAELCVVLGDDALVHGLNRQWRGKDRPTNVLSFSALDDVAPPGAPRLLGDVVLAFETVAAEAAAQGKSLAHHVRHLVVHGVLHLLGYDHEAPGEAERMETLETAVLARLGVPDPYRERETSHG